MLIGMTLLYQEEHEAIIRNRKDPNSNVTWEEYKSMTFTSQVSHSMIP
jgi:hypothetical protein